MDISRRTDRLACLIAACALLAHVSAATQAAEETPPPAPTLEVKRISAEDFGALPFMGDPKLSPDGTRVAARAYTAEGLKLVIIALAGSTHSSKALPIPEKRDLLWHRWAGNDRLLLSLGKAERLMGEDIYASRLMMIDLAADRVEFIGKRTEGPEGDDVLYVHPEGKWLLLNIQETVYDYPSVWRVDLDTIKMKRVVTARDYVWNWYADNDGVVRAGIGSMGRRWWVLYRRDDEKSFEKVISRKTTEEEERGDIDRFFLTADSDKGYAIANTRTGRFGLYRYDFASDTLGEPIFEHPTVDVDDVSFADDGTLRAVHYVDDRSRIEWFDPEMKALQADIDGALPGRLNRVITMSRDKKRMVVWTGTASDPGRLYLFEPDAGAMRLLAKPYEKIDPSALADVESTSYTARDGLRIPAYLTMPRGVGDKNLPLVIMPHGGPFARDEWAYDSWAQFLANRGYVVLQPNFRGSTGYGKEFVAKGEGQWGRGMQDDIDDGVKWLVDRGTVDPKRVCIMGASFGGYAAMWAAARNPEIYRCAISFAGISDVAAMLKYDRKLLSATRYYRSWRESVQGEKTFDLSTVSPLQNVDRISIPILIAHGSRDENVPASQSRKLHEALTKLNRPHEFVIYEGEGHGFEDPGNHTDFFKRVEAFLDKHNPATITEGG